MKREIDKLLAEYEEKFKQQKIKEAEKQKLNSVDKPKPKNPFAQPNKPSGYRIPADFFDVFGEPGCPCSDCSGKQQPVVRNSQGNISMLSPRNSNRISDEFYFNVVEAADDMIDVLLLKHEDYGPTNIANAPGGAVNGLIVRLYDKIARLNNLYVNNSQPNYENLYDTFLDIANYGLIGMLVVEDKWDSGE